MLLNSKLALRLVLWIASTATVIFALGIFGDYQLSRNHIIRKSQLEALQVVNSAIADLQSMMLGVQRSTDLFAGVLGDSKLGLPDITDMLHRSMANRNDYYGAAVAIEPALSGLAQGAAPYFYHGKDGLLFADLAKTYPRGYENEPWYRWPRESATAQWSEPYHDDGGGDALMTTYSVPIWRQKDGQSYFYGVVTADVTLASIQTYLSRIHLGESGFAFLLSQQGNLISYPDTRYLMQTFPMVFPQVGRDKAWQRAISRALDGKTEIVEVTCPHRAGLCILAYSPFGNTGWPIMVVYPQEEMLAELEAHLFKVVLIGLLCVLVMLAAIALISRRITRPLLALTQAADRLGQGDLDTDLPTAEGDDEVAHLVTAFGQMKLRLKEFIARIEKDTASRNRLQGELDAARQIQMEMLPQAGNARVHLPTHEIHARLIPAKAVGGDLYSWFRPDDTHIFLIIGDVSDKGVPAALFMARVITLLQQNLVGNVSPDVVLTILNDQLVERNDACMFATLSCVLVDMESGDMTWASAGHSAPLLRRAGRVIELSQENGPALGLMEAQEFPINHIVLEAADMLVLCTDGIDEAMNPAHELFGTERLKEAMQVFSASSVHDLGELILQRVREHAGEEPQSDDITLLVFAWKGPGNMLIKRDWTHFSAREFPAVIPASVEMFDWLTQWCSGNDISAEVLHDIKLVAEEVFVNIVHYSGLPRTAQISMLLARDRDAVGMEFIDAGRPWNPLEQSPEPELGADTEDANIGGLGIYLVKELTDEQRYRRDFSDNRFCIVKKLS